MTATLTLPLHRESLDRLYVVRAIAGANGGGLTIEAHPSRSLNFRLRLPLAGTSTGAGQKRD